MADLTTAPSYQKANPMTNRKKKATKAKPRPRAAAPKPTTSTALVLSSKQINRVRQELVERLATEGVTAAPVTAGILGEDAAIGMVGQFDIHLTDREEEVLSEAVNLDDVQIKPTGELYLPHEVYTRWFNRAFGRLGWAIVPAARPRTNSKSVVVPYVLYVHGKPAATAWVEQEYHESNERQTLGDAVESTVASALRRIAKRLGVGLELWRRSWLERVVYDRAIPVMVKTRSGGEMQQWRLTNQLPLKGEIGPADRAGASRGARFDRGGEREERGAGDVRRAPAGTDGNGGAKISEPQHRRLWSIAKGAERSNAEVKAWLLSRFGVDARDLLRKDYDYVCEQLEARGSLPGGA
jgi:hypothetical protein